MTTEPDLTTTDGEPLTEDPNGVLYVDREALRARAGAAEQVRAARQAHAEADLGHEVVPPDLGEVPQYGLDEQILAEEHGRHANDGTVIQQPAGTAAVEGIDTPEGLEAVARAALTPPVRDSGADLRYLESLGDAILLPTYRPAIER